MQTILSKLVPAPKTDPAAYEWMIKKTPQHEWIDEQGMFLWLAFFFSEIGAGAYFISLFYDFRPGYVVGYIITLALGGMIHMAYLGNPQRVFGMFLKARTSELSRGMWVILAFACMGFFPSLLGTQYGVVLKALMGFICILLIMHGFATMNVIKAIPSWNQSTVLPLSIVSGIWVGSQLIQFMMGISGREVLGMEVWCRMILLAYIGLIALYLWGTFHASEAANFSVSNLVRGDFSKLFYLGVILIGIVGPLLITLAMWGSGVYTVGIFLRLIFVFIGDLLLRYSIMKSAYYTPLL
ncbi:MAG: DMSO reductase [Syntrophobacteraceae bacterium]|jgi:formate-dependent nitrite reductase membrane component NrfD